MNDDRESGVGHFEVGCVRQGLRDYRGLRDSGNGDDDGVASVEVHMRPPAERETLIENEPLNGGDCAIAPELRRDAGRRLVDVGEIDQRAEVGVVFFVFFVPTFLHVDAVSSEAAASKEND